MAAGPSPAEDPALEDFEADYVPTFDNDQQEEQKSSLIRSEVFSLMLTLCMELGRKNLLGCTKRKPTKSERWKSVAANQINLQLHLGGLTATKATVSVQITDRES